MFKGFSCAYRKAAASRRQEIKNILLIAISDLSNELVVVEFFAFGHLNSGNGPGLSSTVEKFLEVEYITRRTGYIQFFWVDNSAHDRGLRVGNKLENKFLI
jgi:hypothetical protein